MIVNIKIIKEKLCNDFETARPL